MKRFYSLLLLFSVLINAQTSIQIDSITQTNYNTTIVADSSAITAIQNIITFSKTFMGQPKLTGINVTNNYQPEYNNGNWDEGSWFKGYFSDFEHSTDPLKYHDFYNLTPYWSSHPMPRHTSQQIRALIHYDSYFSSTTNSPTIIKGLKYLISQQVKNPTDNTQDGGYIYWNYRPAQNVFEQNDTDIGSNTVHIYETGNALTALCEGYLYLKKNGMEIPENLYTAITKAADNICVVNIGYNSDNYVSIGVWGLSKAYKITQDCKYLNKIIELDEWLIGRQTKEGQNIQDRCIGTWQRGQESYTLGIGSTAQTHQVYHETRMGYHAIILRGLLESLDCIPKTDTIFRKKMSMTIKRAVNHIIRYRVQYANNGGAFGALSDFNDDINCNEIANKEYAFFYSGGDVVECMAYLAYYARFDPDNFSFAETQSLKKLLNIVSVSTLYWIEPNGNNGQQLDFRSVQYMPSFAYYLNYTKAIQNNSKVFVVDNTNFFDSNRTSNPVALDFNNDGIKNEVAYFETNGDKTFLYMVSVSSNGSIESVKKVWESTGYPLSQFSNRVVSGDFDSDGKFDDIAVFYDFGSNLARIHVFKGTGTCFEYQGTNGFWGDSSGYPLSQVGDRVVSGDFDGDGKHDDIATLYDFGNGEIRIHVFQGMGSYFSYSGPQGYWGQGINYPVNNIVGKVISGDFNGDNIDDIATFYNLGSASMELDLFKGTGSTSFQQELPYAWSVSGYPHTQMIDRVVSGDFDGPGLDDIATLYDFGNNEARVHLFKGISGGFSYNGPNGYWESASYDSNKIKGKVVAFDANADGKSEIFAMYNDIPGKDSKLQVLKNTGTGMQLNEISNWWENKCGGYIRLIPLQDTNLISGKVSKTETAKNTAEIKIYKDSDSFEILAQNKIKSVQVFDFSGKLIKRYENISFNKFRFSLQGKGNYIIKMTDVNNKVSTKKILN